MDSEPEIDLDLEAEQTIARLFGAAHGDVATRAEMSRIAERLGLTVEADPDHDDPKPPKA
jgi:hypothetical protein